MSSIDLNNKYFLLEDLPFKGWSVQWPGYESVLVNNPVKASNLLKVLFEEVEVEVAQIAVRQDTRPNDVEIMHISWIAWHQNPDAAARQVVKNYVPFGCVFSTIEQAQQFKLIMERRLAWTKLSGKKWQ